MGKLIVSTQMTLDAVTDQIDGWFKSEGEHEEHSFDQLLAADALLLGRKTYEGLARVWSATTAKLAHYLATNGLVDEIHFWIHPIVWGSGVRPFETRGPVSLRLKSATMFRSGVALLCY